MEGEGFAKTTQYKVIYWDGSGYKRVTELQTSSAAGILTSNHQFNVPDVSGDWHVTVYSPDTYDPDSYDPNDANIVADDTSYTAADPDASFHVAGSAIPEFSTVMAAIAVSGLCFGIYYWMRKRYRRQVATA